MEERKWYVKIIGCGEENSLCVIDLTKSEYDTIIRFIKADTVNDGYDGAYCGIYDIPFDTKEDAIKAIHESQTQEFYYSFGLYLYETYDKPKEEE
jgi:hypothetical protein